MRRLEQVDIMPARIRVSSILRKAILAGEFQAGEELSLTGIASELGVSRTPVREAFQMLESEGLIELRMNKGAVIKEISEKVIRDHYEVRMLLEGDAAARATLRQMNTEELEVYQKSMEAALSDFTAELYRQYNQTFHMAIWKAADNQKLFDMLHNLWNGSSFGRNISALDHQKVSIQEHSMILRYIREREPRLARKEMEHHIQRSMENIISSYHLG